MLFRSSSLDLLPLYSALATIYSLPPELLCRILELCTEDYSLSSAIALSNRYTCLRSASLVSRSWQAPAQSVLWSAVRIYKRTTAQKWLACRVTGVYGTRHLELGGVHSKNEGVSAALAGKIVGRCVGVRELRLCDFGRLSAKVLQSESLAGASCHLPPSLLEWSLS